MIDRAAASFSSEEITFLIVPEENHRIVSPTAPGFRQLAFFFSRIKLRKPHQSGSGQSAQVSHFFRIHKKSVLFKKERFVIGFGEPGEGHITAGPSGITTIRKIVIPAGRGLTDFSKQCAFPKSWILRYSKITPKSTFQYGSRQHRK